MRVISLFSGIGGSSEGYIAAGAEVLASVALRRYGLALTSERICVLNRERDKMSETSLKNKKRRYRKPVSGYKLGDAMPEELRKIGLAYRNNRKRGNIKRSFNKGDQRNVKRQDT